MKIPAATIYKALIKWGQEALGLPAGKVRRAYQDNSPAPFPYPFAYFSIVSIQRSSTNADTFLLDPNTGLATGAQEASMILTAQLDIYGPQCPDLAQAAELHFRSPLGTGFFAPYGLSPCYSTPPVLLSGARDEKGCWGERATMRLIFNLTQSVSYSTDYFVDPELEVIPLT